MRPQLHGTALRRVNYIFSINKDMKSNSVAGVQNLKAEEYWYQLDYIVFVKITSTKLKHFLCSINFISSLYCT
jgi:hypothetical protein